MSELWHDCLPVSDAKDGFMRKKEPWRDGNFMPQIEHLCLLACMWDVGTEIC